MKSRQLVLPVAELGFFQSGLGLLQRSSMAQGRDYRRGFLDRLG